MPAPLRTRHLPDSVPDILTLYRHYDSEKENQMDRLVDVYFLLESSVLSLLSVLLQKVASPCFHKSLCWFVSLKRARRTFHLKLGTHVPPSLAVLVLLLCFPSGLAR